jgi:nuclear pore complex protein Nup98-Nup96
LYDLTIGAFGGAAQSTNSLFGGPSTSVFGAATTSAPAASGSLFGGQAQQSTGSVFGAASTTSAPASGSLFGGQAQQSTGR